MLVRLSSKVVTCSSPISTEVARLPNRASMQRITLLLFSTCIETPQAWLVAIATALNLSVIGQ